MIKKYIRGNSSRGEEVIKELEKLGGENTRKLSVRNDYIYIIDDENRIDGYIFGLLTSKIIIENYEEITLPEPFESKEITFYTEKETSECDGCHFKENKEIKGNCIMPDILEIRCGQEKIIFKLKTK